MLSLDAPTRACNYNPEATEDDGSCDLIVVTLEGTTDAEGTTNGAADITADLVHGYSWTAENDVEVSWTRTPPWLQAPTPLLS